MIKLKLVSALKREGKKRKEYANRIRRELVSLQRLNSQKLLFNLLDLSHLGPNLFSSPPNPNANLLVHYGS